MLYIEFWNFWNSLLFWLVEAQKSSLKERVQISKLVNWTYPRGESEVFAIFLNCFSEKSLLNLQELLTPPVLPGVDEGHHEGERVLDVGAPDTVIVHVHLSHSKQYLV